ncbi:MAG: hypothetical protein WBP80_13075, partial [Planifilum fulgidum]
RTQEGKGAPHQARGENIQLPNALQRSALPILFQHFLYNLRQQNERFTLFSITRQHLSLEFKQ